MVESKRVYIPTTDLLAEGARLAHAKAERYIAGTVHETKTALPATSETAPVSPEETVSPDIPVVRPVVKSDRTVASRQAGMKDTESAVTGKDVDDMHIQNPFGRSRGNDDARKRQQQEEDERARMVVPIEEESSIESEQKRVTVKGETQEGRIRVFVNSLSDGEILILLSKNGQKAYYRRDGDDLVGKNNNIIKTKAAWERYQNGWTVEKKDGEDVPNVPSLKPDMKAPVQVAHDEKKDEEYASGKVFAEQYLELHPPRAEAEVQLDDIIEKAETIDKKTSEQYEELFLGDMWVAKNSDGSEKRILITNFLGYRMVDIRKGADASMLREELEEDESTNNAIVAGTISLETLRNTLREDGYIREDHGSKSERDFLETEKNDSTYSPESPEQQKINELRILVGEFRAAYVKEDVEIKGMFGRLRHILGLKKDEEERQYKEMYEGALKNLRDAEMNMLRNGMAEDGMKSSLQKRGKEEERLLRYYKLDEAVNLINERTQHKAENQKISEKIVNSLGNLGRAYNRIPLKQKLLIAGVFTGVTVATALSGGSTTALGAMAFMSAVRKIASGAGTAVGVEALLESFGERGRTAQAEEEIQEQLGTLKTETLGANPEITFDALSAFLEKDIASLDMKLQNEKRAKTWRKLGAIGVGGLVGSGWLTHFAMEKLGMGEVINSVKEHFLGALNIQPSVPVEGGQIPKGAFPAELMDTQKSVDMRAATEYMAASPEDQEFIRGATGLTDEKLRALVPQPSAPVLSTENIPASLQADMATESISPVQSGVIDAFVDRDIAVGRGDSVWKIAGGLADKLGLEDAQRTHFIDALKDQYGDVRLKAGETINLSEHGIDKEFIEKALGRATSLTADQAASIGANDAKIAEFAVSHPDVTLTNENVDSLLHGDGIGQSDTVTMSDGNDAVEIDTHTVQQSDMIHSEHAADLAGRAVQENIAFTDPTAYLKAHPEDFGRFNSTLGRIRMNIFMMNIGEAGTPMEYDYTMNGQKLGATKISAVLKDLDGFSSEKVGYSYDRMQNPLHYDQMKDVAKFTEATKKAFGVQFSQVEAGENIDHYTRRMATAALRTGKEIKGFYKP